MSDNQPTTKTKQPVHKGVARVPVVMQMEALECGAACLCMIMAYYGKWLPLEQVRSDCGVSRDGSNAKNILKAARSYGMQTAGYKYDPDYLRQNGTFPCIVHWEFNHFIVLKGFKGDKVYINDPAQGDLVISSESFDEGFTGICLEIIPGEEFIPGGHKKSVLSFAQKRLEGAGTAVTFVALTTVITSIAGIIYSGMSRVFMDYLLPGRNSHILIPFFIGLIVIAFIEIAASWINAIYSLKIGGKMAAIGNTTYMWKILRLPMEFFSQRMAGDIQERKESNASIASEIVGTLAPLLLNTGMMFFYLIVMLRFSVLLTIIGILSIVINIGLSRYISNKRINIMRVSMRDQSKLSSSTMNALDLIETIKSSGAENGFFEKWAGYQAAVNNHNIEFFKLNQYLGMLPVVLGEATKVVITIIGVWLVMQGHFTEGMIIAFQGFLTSFMSPAESLISAGQTIQEMRSSMERIEDVMEYPEDPVFERKNLDTDYAKLSGTLSMKNVTFGYSKLAAPVIENFNLELRQGQSVAFVGQSGCGKSTLSKLISGLYQPWSGEILFDGKPINKIDRDNFIGSVAVVDQDITLFEDTIENNIKMWDRSIEDFEMILAARDAGIHEDILNRDGGYQHKLTEGGKNMSGGQKQRLEIARVLAQDPTLIIMDEATSALDARTEHEVVSSIKARGISCIVVAHRLSTIRDCDEIIVLDHGNIVERGTHNELMQKNGMYAQLVTNE